MASLLAKYISKKVLGETLQNNFGKDDPYFESVPATRLDGTPNGKTTKRRKALPPGISEQDGKVLTKVKRRAYRLDMSLFNCCGIRFGWSSVIGIVPGIGDVIDAFMAMMVLRTCEQVEGGLPSDVKTKMYMNIVLDFTVGLVPFIGDIADALFRANTRNAVVLEKYLREKGAKALKAQGRTAPVIDPTDPDEFDRLEEDPPHYTTAPSTRQGTQRMPNDYQNGSGHRTTNQSASQPTSHPQQKLQKERKGSWLSAFGSKSQQPDVERNGELRRREDEPLPSLPQRPQETSRQSRSTQQNSSY